MRFAPLQLLITLLCVAAASAAQADDYTMRTWTNDQGQTIDATLIRLSGSTAILDHNGEVMRAPVNRLSEEDKEWIKTVRAVNRWREWTMADGSTRRAKLDSLENGRLSLKEGAETLELQLDEISDTDRKLLAEVFAGIEPPSAGDNWSLDSAPVSDSSMPSNPASESPGPGNPTPYGTPTAQAPVANTPARNIPHPGIGQTRGWTDITGKTIEAEFRGVEGRKLVLFFKDREWRVPLSNFSADDQQWIAAGRAAAGAPTVAMNQLQPTGAPPINSPGSGSFNNSMDSIRGRMNPGLTMPDNEQFNQSHQEALARAEQQQEQLRQEREERDRRFEERMANIERQGSNSDSETEQVVMRSPGRPNASFNGSPSSVAAYGPQSQFSKTNEPNAFGLLLAVLGGLLSAAGGLWVLVTAFQEGPGWGIGCILVPFVSLLFVVTHLDKAGKPFAVQVGGFVLMFLGIAISSM